MAPVKISIYCLIGFKGHQWRFCSKKRRNNKQRRAQQPSSPLLSQGGMDRPEVMCAAPNRDK